jgi:plastocyanin
VNTDTLGLRHVVVSVKGIPSPIHDGAGPKRIIVNAKCAFEPRVATGRVGDTLEIQNLDPILHNTHVVVGQKTIVNVAQVAGSRPIPKTLKRAGLYVLRCDKHTFMTGALQVFDHPYFAVTDEFGAFQLPPLPAGPYTIVVWHETLGSLEQEITVPVQGMVTINFEYSS